MIEPIDLNIFTALEEGEWKPVSLISSPIDPNLVTFLKPVYDYLGHNVWCAGGAVVRYLEGLTTNEADFDLFTPTPEPLFHGLLASGNFSERPKGSISYNLIGPGYSTIQIIDREYHSLEEVLNSFDFRARMVGTDGNQLLMHRYAKEDIEHKVIKFNPGNFSISTTSLYGLVKYGNRGYKLDYYDADKFLKAWGVPHVERVY
jgi:hypothetical protein